MQASTVAIVAASLIGIAILLVLGFGHLEDPAPAWVALGGCLGIIGGAKIPTK